MSSLRNRTPTTEKKTIKVSSRAGVCPQQQRSPSMEDLHGKEMKRREDYRRRLFMFVLAIVVTGFLLVKYRWDYLEARMPGSIPSALQGLRGGQQQSKNNNYPNKKAEKFDREEKKLGKLRKQKDGREKKVPADRVVVNDGNKKLEDDVKEKVASNNNKARDATAQALLDSLREADANDKKEINKKTRKDEKKAQKKNKEEKIGLVKSIAIATKEKAKEKRDRKKNRAAAKKKKEENATTMESDSPKTDEAVKKSKDTKNKTEAINGSNKKMKEGEKTKAIVEKALMTDAKKMDKSAFKKGEVDNKVVGAKAKTVDDDDKKVAPQKTEKQKKNEERKKEKKAGLVSAMVTTVKEKKANNKKEKELRKKDEKKKETTIEFGDKKNKKDTIIKASK